MTPSVGDIWAYNGMVQKLHYLIVGIYKHNAMLAPLDSIDQQANEPLELMINSEKWSFIV